MSDQPVSREQHEQVVKRAEAAESYACRQAVEQSAIRHGCPESQAHIVATLLGGQVQMVEGRPMFVEQRTAEDGEQVTVHHPVDHGVATHKSQHGYIYRSEADQAKLPDGPIDPSKITPAEFARIRALPGGRAKLGLE